MHILKSYTLEVQNNYPQDTTYMVDHIGALMMHPFIDGDDSIQSQKTTRYSPDYAVSQLLNFLLLSNYIFFSRPYFSKILKPTPRTISPSPPNQAKS